MKKRDSANEALLALEQSLQSQLNPVEPNQQFVGRLRQRLEDSPTYRQQKRLAVQMLTVAVGLVVGLAIFLIGRGFIRET